MGRNETCGERGYRVGWGTERMCSGWGWGGNEMSLQDTQVSGLRNPINLVNNAVSSCCQRKTQYLLDM